MGVITAKRFDVLEYVKKARELGVDEELAEFQARQIGQLADTIQEQQQEIDGLKQSKPVSIKDLDIVKLELQKEIRDIESRLIKWICSFGFGTILAFIILLNMFY